MLFYGKETWLGLLLASIPAFFSLYFFFMAGKKRTALFLLLASAFLIRMVMISLDPYLHEWDERFHALVAKNLISYPFKPMLFAHPVMVHDYKDWSYSHIWLNKQPLFLWQMALSMKVFGNTLIALRLPSALMSTVLVWLTYDISLKWIRNGTVAYISAFITTFGYYSLELVSGRMSLDHNDMAFLFYVTCSFWAFSKYIERGLTWRWAALIGFFAGLAILNKWLAALLIYGGWGLYVILDSESRNHFHRYKHVFLGMITTCLVFLPWQVYIKKSFPLETAHMSAYNMLHFSDALGHPGSNFFHVQFLPLIYDYFIILFMIIGLVRIPLLKNINPKLTISFLSMVLFLYVFFSVFVKTKMPSYVYPVSSLILILSAFGLYSTIHFFTKRRSILHAQRNVILLISTFLIGLFALKPWTITYNRSFSNEKRNTKIYNTSIYKNLNDEIIKDRVILNCRTYENIELMFFKDVTAYHFYPTEQVLDSLQAYGHHFVAFNYPDKQKLTEYIIKDKEILVLQDLPR